MNTAVGITLGTVFTLLAAIHFYWGLGGKWGSDVTIPTNKQGKKVLHPTALACFVVGAGLLAMGIFVLTEAQLLNIPLWHCLTSYGLWAVATIFILRAIGEFNYVGFFKRVKGTNFADADSRYFSPLCLLIGVLALILQLNK